MRRDTSFLIIFNKQKGDGWIFGFLYALFGLAILHAFAILLLGINQPLIGPHSFRQTQTALTAYWLARGGPFFAYETPVLGAPWSTPFEFPLFQWLAAIAERSGLPLDPSGRAISFFFFIFSLLPLRSLLRRLGFDEQAFVVTAILFMCCPLLLFWSRAFLIESCAVFFGLLWLSLLARYVDEQLSIGAVAALVAGSLAAVVKSTTFVPFVFLGASLVAIHTLQAGIFRKGRLSCTIVAAVLVLFPLVVGYGWVVFTDGVKSHNELASRLTSDALIDWNLGTLDQKLSYALWLDTVWVRVLPDTLGFACCASLLTVVASYRSRRYLIATTSCLIAFILPFVIFTNLHVVHSYYQAANAIFLVTAVGISLSRMFLGQLRPLAIAMLLTIVTGQLSLFYIRFYPSMSLSGSDNRLYKIASVVREKTDPAQSLIVIGDDWSSMVPYYAQRKSLVVPSWASSSIMSKMIADPQSLLRGKPFGGIVMCQDRLIDYKAYAFELFHFARERVVLASVDGCVLLGQKRTDDQHDLDRN